MATAAAPTTCAIYVRISQDRTGEELGVERQLEACTAKAAELGLTVTQVYRDNDKSATKANVVRPAFEQLLADRPEVVVVVHVDRLYRKISDLARIIESVPVVHAVEAGRIDLSTASGKFQANILASVAQMEGDMKAERQRAMHAQRRNSGKPWWSHRPFGYEKDGTLREAEAQHLRQAFADLERGVSRASIRARWNAAGILTSTSKPWSHSTFQTLIKSPRNAGLLEVDGKLIKGQWTAVIEADHWHQVMARIKDVSLQGRGQGKLKGLCSGLLHCAKCGAAVRVGPKQAKTGTPTYRSECADVTAPMTELDRAVRNAVSRALSSPAAYLAQGPSDDRIEGLAARAEAERLRSLLAELAEAFAAGEISRQQLATGSVPLNAELAKVEKLAEQSYQDAEQWRGKSAAELLALWESPDGLDFMEKRSLITSLFPSGVLVPRTAGKPFDPALHLRLTDLTGAAVELPSNKRAVIWTGVKRQPTSGESS